MAKKQFSTIHKQNLSRSQKTKRRIQQIDPSTGNVLMTFDSVTEASRVIGVSRGNIFMCLSGKMQKSKGFIWKDENPEYLPKYTSTQETRKKISERMKANNEVKKLMKELQEKDNNNND